MLKINEKYIIAADIHGLVAQEDTKRVDKKGKPVLNTIGFYPTVKSALNGIYRHEVRRHIAMNDMTTMEFINVLEELNTHFEQVLTSLPEREFDE